MTKYYPFFLIFSLYLVPSILVAEETIKLQLKWKHQFQFAGYYAAKELGYYKQQGLNVEIVEADSNNDPSEIVLQGNAEYGTGSNSLLLLHNEGKPLVVLAVILQHSPYILITHELNHSQSIHSLKNKRLMIEPLADELIAYLNHEGMQLSDFKTVQYNHDIKDFSSGKVDAISAYSTDEPYFLKKNNIDFHAYSPRSVGIDFYGDNLFTTHNELKNHPKRVKKFLHASLQGWRYAMTHKNEIANLILNKYSKRKDFESLLYEANEIEKLMRPDIVDIGYMLDGRWRHIAKTYSDLGMLPENYSLNHFLYKPNPDKISYWVYITLLITIFVLIIIASVNYKFIKLTKKLTRLLYIKSKSENIGESINMISHQWKQPLNELGIQLMKIETSADNNLIPKDKKKEIIDSTDKGHNILEFMADTIDVFSYLLKTNEHHFEFQPNIVINDLLSIINDNFKLNKIQITYKLDNPLKKINGSPSDLSHAILNILNNSRDIFRSRKTPSRHIHIILYTEHKSMIIDITDNGGGINIKPLNKAFTLGVSSKAGDDTGIGLYIAKKLIEERFYGSISAKNTDSGALFSIRIPFR